MKSRIIYVTIAALLLVAAIGFMSAGSLSAPQRYHQHRQQPSEAELGRCTQCGGEAALCTHLPIIRIETGGQKIPGAPIFNEELKITGYETGDHGEDLIQADIATVEEENVYHHIDDEASLSSQAMIRYRGNTSRAFSKKGYLIKLIQNGDPEQNNNLPMLGMDSHHEWSLHGPFLDKTLLRNYMWMNLSAEIMGYAPDVRFCELVVDGTYQGVYVLMETIACGEGRVSMTQYEPGDQAFSYMVRIGENLNPLKTIDSFMEYTGRMESETKEVEILYPGLKDQTQQVKDYVEDDFNRIERLLYSLEMNNGEEAWRGALQEDSFVDYYILQEFLMINDMFLESTYFHKDVRGKLCIGPVWDYNNCFDNFIRPLDRTSLLLYQRGWYGQLMMDEEFVEKVIDRYRQLRRTILAEEALERYVDETIEWLGSAVDRNYEVWGYSFDIDNLTRVEYRQPSVKDVIEMQEAGWSEEERREVVRECNPASYEEAVSWLKDCMRQRGKWMDKHIESLRQNCAESKNAPRITQ